MGRRARLQRAWGGWPDPRKLRAAARTDGRRGSRRGQIGRGSLSVLCRWCGWVWHEANRHPTHALAPFFSTHRRLEGVPRLSPFIHVIDSCSTLHGADLAPARVHKECRDSQGMRRPSHGRRCGPSGEGGGMGLWRSGCALIGVCRRRPGNKRVVSRASTRPRKKKEAAHKVRTPRA